MPSEAQTWEAALSEAIDEVSGSIDLRFVMFASSNVMLTDPCANNSGHALTTIPPSISDLANLVVLSKSRLTPRKRLPSTLQTRAPTRVVSAPVSFTSQQRPSMNRASTSASCPTAKCKEPVESDAFRQQHSEIQLYLARNHISKLPSQLFLLKGLIVLSLRKLSTNRVSGFSGSR